MADYTYSALSVYIKNLKEKEAFLRELAVYISPLQAIVDQEFGEDEDFEDNYTGNIYGDNVNPYEYADMFFGNDPANAGNVPQDRLNVKLDLEISPESQLGYLFIPLVSKRLNETVLRPILHLIYNSIDQQDLRQVAYVELKEYEDYNAVTPKLLVKNEESSVN